MSFRRTSIFLLAWLITSCQPSLTGPVLFSTPVLWSPPAPTITPVFPTPAVSKTPSPAPTSTPVTYIVKAGDTLISIATHFGITVDALHAANPDIQERFLKLGQVLKIPVTPGGAGTAQPSPTPVELLAGPVRCFMQSTGGKWCLAFLANPGTEPVEGVFLRFSLYTSIASDPLISHEVALPLSFLPAGGRMPAAVFFAPAEAQGEIARVEVISAVQSSEAGRILPTFILSKNSRKLDHGLEVEFDFQVAPDASGPAQRIEAVLTLLDSSGQPVGFRILRSVGEWQPGSPTHLVLRAYALGGSADQYELILQAYPQKEE